MRLGNLLLKLRGLSPLRYAATKCGHRTKRTGNITAFGQTIMVSMPKNKQGSVDHCLECIGKMAIRCAWCENPIFISEPITLYSPGPSAGFFSSEEPSDIQKAREHNDFAIPDYAVAYREDPLTLVGCLGWNCANTGADRAGFWMPGKDGKGCVQRVPTVFEAMIDADTPSAVIVSDTHDMKEATNPTLIPLENEKMW